MAHRSAKDPGVCDPPGNGSMINPAESPSRSLSPRSCRSRRAAVMVSFLATSAIVAITFMVGRVVLRPSQPWKPPNDVSPVVLIQPQPSDGAEPATPAVDARGPSDAAAPFDFEVTAEAADSISSPVTRPFDNEPVRASSSIGEQSLSVGLHLGEAARDNDLRPDAPIAQMLRDVSESEARSRLDQIPSNSPESISEHKIESDPEQNAESNPSLAASSSNDTESLHMEEAANESSSDCIDILDDTKLSLSENHSGDTTSLDSDADLSNFPFYPSFKTSSKSMVAVNVASNSVLHTKHKADWNHRSEPVFATYRLSSYLPTADPSYFENPGTTYRVSSMPVKSIDDEKPWSGPCAGDIFSLAMNVPGLLANIDLRDSPFSNNGNLASNSEDDVTAIEDESEYVPLRESTIDDVVDLSPAEATESLGCSYRFEEFEFVDLDDSRAGESSNDCENVNEIDAEMTARTDGHSDDIELFNISAKDNGFDAQAPISPESPETSDQLEEIECIDREDSLAGDSSDEFDAKLADLTEVGDGLELSNESTNRDGLDATLSMSSDSTQNSDLITDSELNVGDASDSIQVDPELKVSDASDSTLADPELKVGDAIDSTQTDPELVVDDASDSTQSDPELNVGDATDSTQTVCDYESTIKGSQPVSISTFDEHQEDVLQGDPIPEANQSIPSPNHDTQPDDSNPVSMSTMVLDGLDSSHIDMSVCIQQAEPATGLPSAVSTPKSIQDSISESAAEEPDTHHSSVSETAEEPDIHHHDFSVSEFGSNDHCVELAEAVPNPDAIAWVKNQVKKCLREVDIIVKFGFPSDAVLKHVKTINNLYHYWAPVYYVFPDIIPTLKTVTNCFFQALAKFEEKLANADSKLDKLITSEFVSEMTKASRRNTIIKKFSWYIDFLKANPEPRYFFWGSPGSVPFDDLVEYHPGSTSVDISFSTTSSPEFELKSIKFPGSRYFQDPKWIL